MEANDRIQAVKSNRNNGKASYDGGIVKVILMATGLIVFSMLLIGMMVYRFTEGEVINKLKSKDLLYLIDSIAAKVDGRLERAIETSRVLARDPEVMDWISKGEPEGLMKERALARIISLSNQYDYTSTFVVSTLTRHYWSEEGRIIDTVSEQDPADAWFYDTLKSGKDLIVLIDYSVERADTQAFIDTVMGDVHKPIAVVGVGMSLQSLSSEFAKYKLSSNSNLWLVDDKGKVVLSDRIEHHGKQISDWVPENISKQLLQEMGSDHVVTEFVRKSDGQRVDLISYPLKSANYRLVFAINRSETTGLLSNIKTNTILAIVISLVAILFLFLYMTHRLANPFKRALELNEQLERKVEERTRELAEKNEELLDSIDYAKRIQEAVLPQEQQLQSLFQEQFVIWRPRDGVGGDFYWVKPTSKGCLIAVGDCTGHGVPGAFMTMLAISALNRIYEQENITQPAALVQRLNVVMKETLNERERNEMMDDGLDFGLCSVEQDEVVFVGAKFSLYMADGDEVKVVSGDKTSIGYRRTPSVYPFKEHRLSCSPGTTVYMTTDGYLDQNGGEKGYSFGRRRFAELIRKMQSQTLEEQRLTLKNELDSYRRGERQRDDITVLAFKVNA